MRNRGQPARPRAALALRGPCTPSGERRPVAAGTPSLGPPSAWPAYQVEWDRRRGTCRRRQRRASGRSGAGGLTNGEHVSAGRKGGDEGGDRGEETRLRGGATRCLVVALKRGYGLLSCTFEVKMGPWPPIARAYPKSVEMWKTWRAISKRSYLDSNNNCRISIIYIFSHNQIAFCPALSRPQRKTRRARPLR